MNPTRALSLALAAAVPCLAGAANAAQPYLDLGLRYERLSLDESLEFTCDCDPDEDPECVRLSDPTFCADAYIEGDQVGWLLGAQAGVGVAASYWTVGLRLAVAAGPFEPKEEDDAQAAKDATVALTHVTVELPLELYLDFAAGELFVQLSPRAGYLNYSSGDFEEDPDTFTVGVLLTAGLRFGGDAWKLGGAGGMVFHPTFGGWTTEASLRIYPDIEPGEDVSPTEGGSPASGGPREG